VLGRNFPMQFQKIEKTIIPEHRRSTVGEVEPAQVVNLGEDLEIVNIEKVKTRNEMSFTFDPLSKSRPASPT
jgi:hypothetical protein